MLLLIAVVVVVLGLFVYVVSHSIPRPPDPLATYGSRSYGSRSSPVSPSTHSQLYDPRPIPACPPIHFQPYEPRPSPVLPPTHSKSHKSRPSPARPPARPRPYGSRPPVIRRDERQDHQIIDSEPPRCQVVQEDPTSLRARANKEGDLMTQCFQQSKRARELGHRARAKSLSEEGKRHKSAMETLHAQASASIFEENNRNLAAGEIDLHGLYVKEAITYSNRAIDKARQRGDTEIRLIVGRGTHSDRGVAKIKPAIQEEVRSRGLPVDVDPRNSGVLLVRVDGRSWW